MRILLTSNASHAPARGGSTRSNLVWLRHLVDRGHSCRVVCSSLGEDAETVAEGIRIHSVQKLAQRRAVLEADILAFHPDLVLVSSEDLSHVLLREAARVAADRIVYLAHTPQFFPFGGESWNKDPRATEIVRGARAVVAIGQSTAAYIEQAAGVKAHVIHPPIYGQPPFARLGSFETRRRMDDQSLPGKGHRNISGARAAFSRCPFFRAGGLGNQYGGSKIAGPLEEYPACRKRG